MARSTSAAPAIEQVDVEPRRPEDRRGYYADAWLRSLAWPAAFLGALIIGIYSAIFVLRGRVAAGQWLEDITGPAFLAGLGTLIVATVTLVFKVRQIAKAEMHAAAAASTSASTKEEVASSREENRRLVEQVLVAVKAQSGGGSRELDPTTGEIKALVQRIAGDMSTINERLRAVEAGTAIAARASKGAQETVVGYGGYMRDFASAVTGITGQTPAQRPADSPQSGLWTPGGTEPRPGGYGAPEARTGRYDYADDAGVPDWSRRDGSHRALTSQQPAVPAAPAASPTTPDEHEDWREGDNPDGTLDDEDGDGPGLDTSLIKGFRADMARADAAERAARESRPAAAPPTSGPAPIWPGTRPAEQADLPPHIRAARDRAREQMARERADYWSNPEEGPK